MIRLRTPKNAEAPEFGFGTLVNKKSARLMNPDGSANVHRLGERSWNPLNIYHRLVNLPWLQFNLLVLSIYAMVTLIFALGYFVCGPETIGGMIYANSAERFAECFFFSAQTLTTVGYGRIHPIGPVSSSLAAIESFVGLMGFALATGLLFTRFARPNAKLLYSQKIIVSPYSHKNYEGKAEKALMFRLANARNNTLIEAECQVLMGYQEEYNGKPVRRFQLLKLEIARINLLSMSWTLVHPLDDESPLKGLSYEEMKELEIEFLVSVKAIDETYSQHVYSRTSYLVDDLVMNARFDSPFGTDESGKTTIDLRKISDYHLLPD